MSTELFSRCRAETHRTRGWIRWPATGRRNRFIFQRHAQLGYRIYPANTGIRFALDFSRDAWTHGRMDFSPMLPKERPAETQYASEAHGIHGAGSSPSQLGGPRKLMRDLLVSELGFFSERLLFASDPPILVGSGPDLLPRS